MSKLRRQLSAGITNNVETRNLDQITDISSNGAIAVKLVSTDPEAAATFWQWIGGNYVDLRHKYLERERSKRSD